MRIHRGALLALSMSWLVLSCGGGGGGGATAGPGSAKPPGATAGTSTCLAQANVSYAKKPDEPSKIGVRHILVRHAESKNPSGATRTREEGCERALEARKKLESGADWDAVATEFSDEKGVSERHGALGVVARDVLDPAFADAAFTLGVDETSYVVESKAGFHVIQRTE